MICDDWHIMFWNRILFRFQQTQVRHKDKEDYMWGIKIIKGLINLNQNHHARCSWYNSRYPGQSLKGRNECRGSRLFLPIRKSCFAIQYECRILSTRIHCQSCWRSHHVLHRDHVNLCKIWYLQSCHADVWLQYPSIIWLLGLCKELDTLVEDGTHLYKEVLHRNSWEQLYQGLLGGKSFGCPRFHWGCCCSLM